MQEKISPHKVYTTEEARDFLKVSDSTMKRMLKNGIIRAYKVSGQYRIWGSEILMLVSPKLESRIYRIYFSLRNLIHRIITRW